MFKLISYLNANGDSLNPFDCAILRSYLRDQVVVITEAMLEHLNGMSDLYRSGTQLKRLIIIGNRTHLMEGGISEDAEYVSSISKCIIHIAEYHRESLIWLLADNATANKLIWNGTIMEIHLSKNYSKKALGQDVLDQEEALDTSLIVRRDMEFEVISSVRDSNCETKCVRHYLRRNVEELTLLAAMRNIVNAGYQRPNRTGIDTRALFGKQFEYTMIERVDPQTGISSFRLPLLTTKRMFTRGVFAELKWFLSGETDSKILESQGVNIWKGNSSKEFLKSRNLDYDEGVCGPIYGYQWKHWGGVYPNKGGIDQVQQVIDSLQRDPFGRRHIINAWNVGDLDKMSIPPCHMVYQFSVHQEGSGPNKQKYLSLFMYQRSADAFLGIPFNLCSMGMFLIMMAHRVGMKPFKIIHSIADFHIYETHIEQTQLQVQREPFMFPYVRINEEVKPKLEDYNYEDLIIDDYTCHPRIQADMVA